MANAHALTFQCVAIQPIPSFDAFGNPQPTVAPNYQVKLQQSVAAADAAYLAVNPEGWLDFQIISPSTYNINFAVGHFYFIDFTLNR